MWSKLCPLILPMIRKVSIIQILEPVPPREYPEHNLIILIEYWRNVRDESWTLNRIVVQFLEECGSEHRVRPIRIISCNLECLDECSLNIRLSHL